ncbi:MAG: leucyl aminopeptidase [Gammaproteobacteria bacterium]|nr:leucyl aminopeptidase [Gammaproteobacteria bacterium]
MDFNVTSTEAEHQKSACLIVSVFEKGKLGAIAKSIDEASNGHISSIVQDGDIKGKIGQVTMLHKVPGIQAPRVMLVGCGDDEKGIDEGQFNKAVNKAVETLKASAANECTVYLGDVKIKGKDKAWAVRAGTIAFQASTYRADHLKSKKEDNTEQDIGTVNWYAEDAEHAMMTDTIALGIALGKGINLARELGNLPGNICTPSYLAETAINLASRYDKIDTTVLEESDMEKLGMGALLSVSRGSRQPAKLIIMEYKGGKKGDKPIIYVGKGLTFDSGGISIKPSPSMDEMKYDMCGGASVLGTMYTIAELGLPINVVGVVPSSENMPDGDANKPGDIVTSLSGQTIEVLNTDAEGRLILCDALTYIERYDPKVVIDIATLTGACVVALGKHATGMLSNDDDLADAIRKAAKDSYDRVWQLPLWEDYQEQLKSNFADMANVGGPQAGTITAACFLARYTKSYKWAHLDIAGTAWNTGAEKGATGRPVSLLVQYALNNL